MEHDLTVQVICDRKHQPALVRYLLVHDDRVETRGQVHRRQSRDWYGSDSHNYERARVTLHCKRCGLNVVLRQEKARELFDELVLAGADQVRLSAIAAMLS
jgi:hypothetical protein